MKKIIVLALAFILTVSLLSCQSDNITIPKDSESSEEQTINEQPTTEYTEETAKKEYPKYFFAIVEEINQDGSLTVNICDAYKEAFGDKATIYYSQNDNLDFTPYHGAEIQAEFYTMLDDSKNNIGVKSIMCVNDMVCYKPVIYLYPTEETKCSVKVNIDGSLTCTYPEHGESGWCDFTAYPDGTLVFPDGKEYYCLYWEGIQNTTYDFSKGVCVKGSDTAKYLEYALSAMGLTPREANEFIIYWLPILQNNPYNVISFQAEAYTDKAKLEIAPNPDSLLRIFMAAYASDEFVDIEPQEFCTFERVGFTVVEWGGSVAEK